MALHFNIELGGGEPFDEEDGEGLTGLDTFFAKLRNGISDLFTRTWRGIKQAGSQMEDLRDTLTEGAGNAGDLADQLDKAGTAASQVARVTKRFLAGFDEIQRLNAKTAVEDSLAAKTEEANRLAAIVHGLTDKLKEAMTALKTACAEGLNIFFVTVQAGFQELMSVRQVISGLMAWLRAEFTGGWNGLWTVLSDTGKRLNALVLEPVLTGANTLTLRLQENFRTMRLDASALFTDIAALAAQGWASTAAAWSGMSTWFGAHVGQPVAGLFAQLWAQIAQITGSGQTRIQQMLLSCAVGIGDNALRTLAGQFTQLWENIASGAARTATGLQAVFTAALTALTTGFRESWVRLTQAFSRGGTVYADMQEGTASIFKTFLNDLIRGFNAVLQSAVGGLNMALLTLKNTEIQGSRPFAGIRTLSVPQIPYLAQGAVLPANRPFLAVVGDQRSGTNVEAPLSTIQEAVAAVMEGQTDELALRLEASLAVQRDILQAVLGIEIGDTVIGQAAGRYQQKLAVVHGGAL